MRFFRPLNSCVDKRQVASKFAYRDSCMQHFCLARLVLTDIGIEILNSLYEYEGNAGR